MSSSDLANNVIWLDKLPTDITHRIANFVSSGTRSVAALNLAEASALQREAVVASLSYTLSLDDSHLCDFAIPSWVAVFSRHIRHLHIPEHILRPVRYIFGHTFGIWLNCRDKIDYACKLRDDVLALLDVPTLSSVSTTAAPNLLTAIPRASTLDRITIAVDKRDARFYLTDEDERYAYAPLSKERYLDHARHIMTCLQALPSLRRLSLSCLDRRGRSCPLDNLLQLQGTPLALSTCCPQLEVFQADACLCHSGEAYWQLWSSLPNIREVHVRRKPPSSVLDRLEKLSSVKLNNMVDNAGPDRKWDIIALAKRLGSIVTVLRVDNLQKPDITPLHSCFSLTELELRLGQGSERDLVSAVGKMPNLRSLHLKWDCDKDGTPYYKALPGVLPSLVRSAPALKSLDLLEVRINPEELVAILNCLGAHLQHFGTSLCRKRHRSFEHFKMLFETMLEHNSELRTLAIDAEPVEVFRRIHIDNIDTESLDDSQWLQLTERRECMRRWMIMMKRRMPFLDKATLNNWIEYVHWVEA